MLVSKDIVAQSQRLGCYFQIRSNQPMSATGSPCQAGLLAPGPHEALAFWLKEVVVPHGLGPQRVRYIIVLDRQEDELVEIDDVGALFSEADDDVAQRFALAAGMHDFICIEVDDPIRFEPVYQVGFGSELGLQREGAIERQLLQGNQAAPQIRPPKNVGRAVTGFVIDYCERNSVVDQVA